MKSETSLKNQLMAWASCHNLNWLIGFHNYIRGLLKERLQFIKSSEVSSIDGKIEISALYDYDRILHVNTFLMMYSYFEEWLYHSWKIHATNIELEKGKGSIRRYNKVVQYLGINLSSDLWRDLIDSEKLRNCLLHANGRISLCNKPEEMSKIIQRNKLIQDKVKDQLVITSEYLQKFNETVSNCLDIFHQNDAQQPD